MLMQGKVLRFDEFRGYGFIVPEEGDEDVFMHANDLLDDKYLYQAGSEVEFFLEMGDKGPKASQIRLVYQPSSHQLSRSSSVPRSEPAAAAQPSAGSPSARDFSAELTDALLESAGSLTADQIKQVRSCVLGIAKSRGWLDA
ncbi:cold shock domain-containing protein [Streptomyces oceani]|uniref:DNA-binding protein n=1 Tax=Streptomyces oceani TaxID=1075402 RepID=A0A1E7KJD0_9ACTN|nr:cold shock domain-containing protein [Streptomyces oceani]OEV04102.1 DNA-binding protein [Streptomyces oceani]